MLINECGLNCEVVLTLSLKMHRLIIRIPVIGGDSGPLEGYHN